MSLSRSAATNAAMTPTTIAMAAIVSIRGVTVKSPSGAVALSELFMMIFKEHDGLAPFRAHAAHHAPQAARQPLALGVREAVERGDELRLRRIRRPLHHSGPGSRERQLQPARIRPRSPGAHQPTAHQFLDD